MARSSKECSLGIVEAIRISAVLEKAIERLQLLSLIGANIGAKATTQEEESGDADSTTSIAHLLEEHKRLQDRYQDLLAQKSLQLKRKSMLQIATFEDDDDSKKQAADPLTQELQAVSKQLKTYSKQIFRQLKENPNEADNWKKIQRERNELQNLLTSCLHEINTGTSFLDPADSLSGSSGADIHVPPRDYRRLEVSYEIFANKVLLERDRKTWADEVVQRERQALAAVKKLKEDLEREKALRHQEMEQKSQALNQLKKDLRDLKERSQSESKRKTEETQAEFEAARRVEADRIRILSERLEELQQQLEEEQIVNEETERFLQKKHAELSAKNDTWSEKFAREKEDLDAKIDKKTKERDNQKIQLEQLRAQLKEEQEKEEARLEDERKVAEQMALDRLLEKRLRRAVRVFEEAWLLVLASRKAAAEKKKSKGGKGKKEGKGEKAAKKTGTATGKKPPKK